MRLDNLDADRGEDMVKDDLLTFGLPAWEFVEPSFSSPFHSQVT